MTGAVQSLWRRLARIPLRFVMALLALLLLLGLLLGAPVRLLPWSGAEAVPEASAALPPAMPRELVEIARGEGDSEQAEGEAAQQINAALPFSRAALEAANPLLVGTASDNGRRALRCLTQAVYYEAGYESEEGKRAVAQVVLNRLRHPAYPRSVCGVVYDGSSRPGCQFSFTCDGSLRRAPSPAAWAAAERIARDALSGSVASSVGMATHYHADYVAPYWAPRLAKLRQIGTHIFYRWPGGWGRRGAFTDRYAGIEGFYEGRTYTPASGVEIAEGPLALPPDPTDRHAPNDVGGRLDVSKGWTLNIPDPAETGGHYSATRERQAATGPASPAPLAAGASGDR